MAILRDHTRVVRSIPDEEIVNYIASSGDFKLLGMDIPTIRALRTEYLERNGPPDMTPETVKKVFR